MLNHAPSNVCKACLTTTTKHRTTCYFRNTVRCFSYSILPLGATTKAPESEQLRNLRGAWSNIFSEQSFTRMRIRSTPWWLWYPRFSKFKDENDLMAPNDPNSTHQMSSNDICCPCCESYGHPMQSPNAQGSSRQENIPCRLKSYQNLFFDLEWWRNISAFQFLLTLNIWPNFR